MLYVAKARDKDEKYLQFKAPEKLSNYKFIYERIETTSIVLKGHLIFNDPSFLGATTTIQQQYLVHHEHNYTRSWYKLQLALGVIPTVAVTATANVTAPQSGSLFYINSAAAAVTLSLPAVLAGLRYKFIVPENKSIWKIIYEMLRKYVRICRRSPIY